MNVTIRIFFFLLAISGKLTPSALADPVVLGLEGNHPLSSASAGRLLIDELRCAACHETQERSSPSPSRPAPDLERSAALIRADYLKRFIAEPHQASSQTLMPELLAQLKPERKEHVALALAHYLKKRAMPLDSEVLDTFKPTPGGKEIYETTGCVVCHGPSPMAEEPANPSYLTLAHVTEKYSEPTLAAFLYQPLKYHPGGAMPEMGLTQDEAAALATFLFDERSPRGVQAFEPDEILAQAGEQFFREFNCAACHERRGSIPATPAIPLTPSAEISGCLAENPKGVPNFHLSQDQRNAISEALQSEGANGTNVARDAVELTRFNCIACHERGAYGGPAEPLIPYFETSEPELGDAARIPPPLTHVGARIKPAFLQKILFDGATYRPYMKTRMPQFGAANLKATFESLLAADSVEPAPEPTINRDTRRAFRDAGGLLLGDQGLNCISCHNFNQAPSPGFQGIDLVASYERLNPDFFFHYLENPAAFRPGIVMPSYWPGGESTRKDILNGSATKQRHAIGYYLSLGTSASLPSGMRNEGSRIRVTSEPVLYRGRSSVAGYRGIAVGFPNGPNYAFDAQNGALAAIWKGDFVSVRWAGQGAGNFDPLSRPAQLPRDVAFQLVETLDTNWPLRPQTNKENPVNPDPEYPKNHGFQFRGYSLDQDRIPTLDYSIGPVTIQDRIEPTESSIQLQRALTFHSPNTLKIAFRIATGEVRMVSPTTAETQSLFLKFDPCQTILRPLEGVKDGKELILIVNLPSGESTFSMIYEQLR